MGYMGTRLYADREDPGRFLIVADFGVVDPDVSAAEEAARNNDRPETQERARRDARARTAASPSATTTTSSTAPTSDGDHSSPST